MNPRLLRSERIPVTADDTTAYARIVSTLAPVTMFGLCACFMVLWISSRGDAHQFATVNLSIVPILGGSSLLAMVFHRNLVARGRHALAAVVTSIVIAAAFWAVGQVSVDVTDWKYSQYEGGTHCAF